MNKRFFSIAFAAALCFIGAPVIAVADIPPVAPAVEAVADFDAATEKIKADFRVVALHSEVSRLARASIGTMRVVVIDRSSGAIRVPDSAGRLHAIAEPEPVPWTRE